MSLLNDYETLLGLSHEMAKWAQEQAWDKLAQTEAERRALLKNLASAGLPLLPAAQQQAVAAIILQIQDCDRAVLEYVLPWQEHVRPLLARFAPKP